VLLTFPLIVALAPGLRALRLFRLLRLLRLARMARTAFSVTGLRYAALLALLTVLGGGEAYALIEGGSFADGVYWAATTMTTVGYGDITPDTATGKMLAVAVMLVGIGFVAVLTGAIAERFIAADVEQVEATEAGVVIELRRITDRLDRIEARLPQDL